MSLGFSGNLLLSTPGQVGYPYVGYDNIFTYETATVDANVEEPEHPKELAINGYTNDAWIGGAAVLNYLGVSLTAAKKVNYIGIAAHNLHLARGVKVTYSTDGWATSVDATDWINPPTDSPVMAVFEPVYAAEFRVWIDADTLIAPYIGVLYVGEALQMEQGVEPSYAPIALARDNEATNSLTIGGHFVGRSIIRRGASGDLSLNGLTPEWVRGHWQAFMASAELKPFFFGWALQNYPWEVAYCWTDGGIKTPAYSTPTHMGVTLRLKGIN